MDATLRIIEELDIVCLLLSKSYLTNVGVKLQINLSYKKTHNQTDPMTFLYK